MMVFHKLNKENLKSKNMNSRLFHLQGVDCKIVNCTQLVKKERKLDEQTKR